MNTIISPGISLVNSVELCLKIKVFLASRLIVCGPRFQTNIFKHFSFVNIKCIIFKKWQLFTALTKLNKLNGSEVSIKQA